MVVACACARARAQNDHARVCVRVARSRVYAHNTRMRVKSADRERNGEVSENYTLLLFSTLYKSLPSKHLRASFHPCFQRANGTFAEPAIVYVGKGIDRIHSR